DFGRGDGQGGRLRPAGRGVELEHDEAVVRAGDEAQAVDADVVVAGDRGVEGADGVPLVGAQVDGLLLRRGVQGVRGPPKAQGRAGDLDGGGGAVGVVVQHDDDALAGVGVEAEEVRRAVADVPRNERRHLAEAGDEVRTRRGRIVVIL